MAKFFKTENEKALEAARKAANSFKFGTQEWEAAMTKVRELVEMANSEDQAILNHRCDFSR